MRKILVLLFVAIALLGFGTLAYAVPDLGVATGTYIEFEGSVDYVDWFMADYVSGSEENHGFLIDPSPATITAFTWYTDTPLYLLITTALNDAISPTITLNGDTTPFGDIVPISGQFNGYVPDEYVAYRLPNIDSIDPDAGPWFELVDFPSDESWKTYYGIDLTFTYTGSTAGLDAESTYVFMVADADLDGVLRQSEGDPDPFSPKTDSARVPEPETVILLGMGILIVGLLGRIKFIHRNRT